MFLAADHAKNIVSSHRNSGLRESFLLLSSRTEPHALGWLWDIHRVSMRLHEHVSKRVKRCK